MILSDASKRLMKERKINCLVYDNNLYQICREEDAGGNTIHGYKSIATIVFNVQGDVIKEIRYSVPPLYLYLEDTHFLLRCWESVPGPFPGDFEKIFESEPELIDFIESYYFGQNEYFQIKKQF
jgi:hypothetical protein